MHLPRQFHFLAVLLIFASSLFAQSPGKDEHAQKLWKAEQGMSEATKARMKAVRSAGTYWCAFQDSQGVLWFGTDDGLLRYAEGSFTTLTTADGLNNNRIFSIMEDKDGFLWFGTENGLCKYDRKTFVHVPIPWSDFSGPWTSSVYPIFNPNQVTSMLQDKAGDFWIGTNGAGAYHFDGKTFTNYLLEEGSDFEDGTHHNVITNVLEDAAGHIWFTSISHAGASRFDGKSFQHYSVKDGLSDDMIRSIYQSRDGKLWFGTHGQEVPSGKRDGGLDFFDGKTFTQLTPADRLLSGFVMCIYEDTSGNIWVGLGIGAMCIYDGEKFSRFTSESGRTFSGVSFITEDASGNVWFGGTKGKLFRYDGESVTDFSKKRK